MLSIAVSCATAAWSQAVPEHAAISAASATGTAATSGIGKSIGGVFGALNKKLESAKTAKSSTPGTTAGQTSSTVTVRSAESTSPRYVPKLVDPSQVTIGLDRDELLKCCGEPMMITSQTRDSQVVETYWYTTIANDTLMVTIRDGRVASLTPPPVKKNETAGATQK